MIARCSACLLISAVLGGCTVTPAAFSERELQEQAADRASRIAANEEPVTGPIGLHEAMARALKYNLNARAELLDTALKQRQLELSNAAQLPKLVAELDYSGRSNDSGSSSKSLLTGMPSLESSTSSDRQVAASDLSLSWNILDFGLSYVRANQAADAFLIAREKRRKAIHSLLQEVRGALWKAVAAEKLSRKLKGLDARIRSAHREEQALEQRGNSSPLIALTRQRELLELQVELEKLNGELGTSKAHLAALMNLPPGTDFKLSAAGAPAVISSALPPANDMVSVALRQRPELRQAGYSSRINQREAEAALLELLPGIGPFLSVNYDTNSYLYNNSWIAAGAKASWNLMKVFSYPQKKAAIAAGQDLLDKKALATAMAVITQVYVSRLNYFQARRKLRSAQQFYNVEKKIFQQLSSAHDAGSIGGHSLLRQEMRLTLAEVKRDLCYSGYESAFGVLFASVGADVIGEDMDETKSVQEIAHAIAHNWRVLSSPPFFTSGGNRPFPAGKPS